MIYHTTKGNFTTRGALKEIIDKTRERIENIAREVEIGKIYTGRVVKVIDELGCFVELWPGTEGLVHVSQLDKERITMLKTNKMLYFI